MEELYNQLNKEGKYTKSFENFQVQFGTPEKSEKLYSALNQAGDYTKSFDDFKVQFNVLPEGVIELTDEQVGKTNDSANADPAVESNQNDTGSKSGNGSLGWVDSAFKLMGYEEDFSNTKEENTFVEDFFGKNIVTDVVGDVIRAAESGAIQNKTLDPSLKYFSQGKDISDEDLNKLVVTGRALENAPLTEEMIAFQDEYAKIRQEAKDFVPGDEKGASGVASDAMAFFLGWARNPSAMTQYSAQSLANMALSAKDNLGKAATGAAVFAGGAKLLQKYGGKYGKLASIPMSFVAGAMGTTSGIMETGFTTADLVQNQAFDDGLNWQEMSNAERAGYYKKIANDENLFNEIKSKAIARGFTIGGIDAFTTLALGPSVRGVSGKVATSRLSGLTGLSKVGTAAAVETAGGMFSEVAGQAAAGQEFNTQEILMEGFADKTLTLGTAVNSLLKEGPSYSLNGEKMNGGKFVDALKLMDDEAYVKADIKISDSPVASEIVSNRRQNIATDQKVDSRINGVADRAAAIKLTRELNSLENNKTGNAIKITQTKIKLQNISDLYENSTVDASIEQRKQAVADAVSNEFEASFNKNTTAGYQDIGIDPIIAETDNEFFQKIAEATNTSINEVANKVKDSNGVFAGGGKVFINKAKAKRSIDIATGNKGAVTIASHEVLHPIFNALIGGVKAQGAFVNEFKSKMTSKQRAYVRSQLKLRNYSKAEEATELMNVFSDGIISGEINYDLTTFDKFKGAIANVFSNSDLGNISFDNGQDVYNFLKEYNTSIKAGKLSDTAIQAVKAAEKSKGVKVSEASAVGDAQLSKTVEQAETDLENAQNADPNDPRYFDNLDAAEAALDAAEDAALNPVTETTAKPKPAPKAKTERPTKPTRTTDLSPRDPISKKIMDTYNEGMEGVERPEYKANKPLPASLERKLVPMFEGYINTIVQQKFKQLGPEALEFQDALSILRAEVVSAIRTFNPKVNKDLAGYVKRYGVQARQSLMFKDANTEFTSDLDDAKTVIAKDDTPAIDRSGTVERGQATFDELDIVDDTLVEDIKSDLEKEIRVRVQKGTLSETINVKKGRDTYIVSWLEDYVNKQLFKKLSKKLGAIGERNGETVIPGAYIDFLNNPKTFDIITKALPIKSIKKSYGKLFPTERVGREVTAEGNPVFKIGKIDKRAFLTYFVDGKKSTILERQKQLFREILEPLAKQVVANFATPENIATLEEIKQLAPETALDVTEEIVIKAQLKNLESKLDRYKGEQAGFDIIQFSNEGSLIKYDSKQVTATGVKKALKFDEHSEEFLSLNTSLQHATNWVRETLQLKGATLGGIIYEVLSMERISSSAKTLGIDLKVKTLRGSQAGFDSNRPDIELTVKKENVPVELKQSVYARFGQTTLGIEFTEDGTKFIVRSKRKNADGSKKPMTFEDIPTGQKLKEAMEKSEVHLKAILKQINKIEKTEFNSFPLGKSIKISTVDKIKKSKAYRALAKISTDADGQTVSDHYNAKDTHVLQIGSGKGLFLLGDDVYNLNGNLGNTQDLVPNINSLEFKGVMRLKFNYNRKAGTSSLSLISEPQIKDKKSVTKSPINLDSKRGVAAFYNRFKQIQSSKTSDQNLNKARAEVNLPEHPIKGISVWDFDDTLATTKSNVLYTMPDGTRGKIDATEFALDSDKLSEAGAKFDFSEFEKVMKGKKGPMFEKAVARNKKFGNSNVYILTARPANAKYAIHEFLKGIGLNIKLNNIVGLGDGTAIAKAKWVVGKVAEGYNDFYFADDAYKNVAAVQSVLKEADVKSKVHQAKMQFSKDLNSTFNDILEDSTGINAKDVILEGRARIKGEKKGRFDFFIPPSAEDFQGLMYKLTGQGKVGERQQAWFKKALFDPFARGVRDFESYKQNAAGIVNNLKKSLKDIPAGLNKVNGTGYTNEVAARVILWRKNGHVVPGLDQSEISALIKIVQNNPDLLAFVKQIDKALGGYPAPQNDWLAGTLTTDAINMINTTKRSEFLQEWKANVDLIFSKENMNKMEAGFGKNYTEALEDMLYRMETGRNRPSGKNKQTNQFMNWVNDSVGTIMFFNTRSALLQLLSTVNFVNWGDNNPVMAAKAFANQDQFWKDFAMLFNSDFLKQRRSGLKNDVNADDIANAAATATNKTRAALSSLLKVGFLPTQMADSFAIAMGGASFIRNRINTYTEQGMSKAAAKERAFLDFQEIAEETQQSSRPDRVSQQQASPLGRIVLAFANTPMQYMRLTKKAVLDLKNGRGDPKTNITKILYYTFVQNVIFSGLQAALFAAAFEDEDEETIENKQLRTANSMVDSVLRGTGVYGAIASTLKNILLEINKQSNKDRPDYTQASLKMLSISPPIDSKLRKALSIGRAFSYKKVREKMFKGGLDDPALYALGQGVSAVFNIPLDRAIRKLDNVKVALSNDTRYWQKVALLLGWSQWDLGLIETSSSKKKGFGGTSKWKTKGSWNKEKGSWNK
mgnify:CR=1 FL=1